MDIKNYYNKIYSKSSGLNINSKISDFIRNEEIVDFLNKLLKSKKKIKVADFGCSNGDLLYLLQRINNRNLFFGIDISDEIILRNKKKNNDIIFSCQDLLNTNFEENFFDLIISSMVIEHIKNDKEMIEEIHRVLNKDGILVIISVLKKDNAWYYLKNKNGESVLELSHVKEYKTIEDFTNLFDKNKFNIILTKIEQIKFPFIDFFLRRIKILNRLNLSFLRAIRIPVKGYYSIECIVSKK